MPHRKVYTYGIGADESSEVKIPIVKRTWRCDRCTDGNREDTKGRLHATESQNGWPNREFTANTLLRGASDGGSLGALRLALQHSCP